MAFDIASLIPVASVNSAIWMLIESLIVSVVVIIADRIIAHEMEFKHAVLVSIAAFFAIPFLFSAITLVAPIAFMLNFIIFYGLPLLVWIVLAEAFLGGADHKTKIGLAFIAWIAYLAVGYVGMYTGIPSMLAQYVPF